MRIGIDARYLSHGLIGGVHTYVANLVPALVESASGHQVFLYADTKRPFELQALPASAVVRMLPYRNTLSSFYHDFFMSRQMGHDRLDVVHFPANYGFAPRGVPSVITLHDAINILPLPEIIRGHTKNARTILMMTYLHFCTRAAVLKAALLVTVSEHARHEIARHSRFDLNRIVVLPHAPTPDLRRIEEMAALSKVRQCLGLTKPFVLADAVKNPTTVVRAWQLLPAALRENYEIVFFARSHNVLPVVKDAVDAGIARLLVQVSREDLIALYNIARAFVFPSWIEGFGLPILEAMACGAPVIASDRGAIPEVANGAALLADAEDADAFARHIARVLTDPNEAQRLRELGFARAERFSWRDVAQRTLGCYQRVVDQN